jgi:hypothetical protein
MGFHRFVNGVRVPHAIFKRATAIVVGLRRASLQLVLKPLDAIEHTGREFTGERAAEAVLLNQIAGDMPELCWKVFMDEQDVHGILRDGRSNKTASS